MNRTRQEKQLDLSGLPVTHTASIPEEYRDVMGHMNVMWYTHLFDCSIFGFFENIGLDLEYMRQHDGGSFALETHIRYLAEVHVGDQVTLHSRVIGRSEKRFHLLNFMMNDTHSKLASTFEVVGCYIQMATRKMAPIPTDIAQKFDRIAEAHQRLDWDAPVSGVMKP